MSKKYLFKRILWWLVTCLFCGAAIFGVIKRERVDKEEKTQVISLWHIDTFEGGRGSRAAFLGKAASLFEKEHGGVVVMVTARTIEGAKADLESGARPDLISFGSYFPYLNESSSPVVWCRGGYALYSLQDDFSSLSSAKVVLSSGGRNQPTVAAALCGLADFTVEESTAAYVKFLNEEYRYLLGTQRDACRFASRGTQVYCLPLTEFSDLQQYILPLEGENKPIAKDFIGYLLEEKCQKLLPSIGMFSPSFKVYDSDTGTLDMLEEVKPLYTVSPFMDEAAALAMRSAAEKNLELLKNFLKVS